MAKVRSCRRSAIGVYAALAGGMFAWRRGVGKRATYWRKRGVSLVSGLAVSCDTCVCVSTPVSKDTTLTLSNLPYDFCDQCTAAGGHSTHHQGVANEEPGGVVLKTYLPF